MARLLLFSFSLAVAAVGCSSRDEGRAGTDAGSDASIRVDSGERDGSTGRDGGQGTDGGSSDGGVASDAGSSDGGPAHDGATGHDGSVDWDGCVPPPCPAPPDGCMYVGATMCTCGTLVCTTCGALTPCTPSEWCDFPDGMACGSAGGTGTCMPRPAFCADIYMPVCGCDGVTHGNECEAHAAGTDVASSGECAP